MQQILCSDDLFHCALDIKLRHLFVIFLLVLTTIFCLGVFAIFRLYVNESRKVDRTKHNLNRFKVLKGIEILILMNSLERICRSI